MWGPPPATGKHDGKRVEALHLCSNERCLNPARQIRYRQRSNAQVQTAASKEALHRWLHHVGPMAALAAAAADAAKE